MTINERYAQRIAEDAQHDKRIQQALCRQHYYNSVVGGAALTAYTCENCGKEDIYSITATPRWCKECAQLHHVCRYCLRDLEKVREI